MTQATGTPPGPTDADAISRTITAALTRPPSGYVELAELHETLLTHMERLWPAVTAAVDRTCQQDSTDYHAHCRMDYIRRQMDEQLGITAETALRQVGALARGCSWLLERASAPPRRMCPRCHETRADTRMVSAVESGTGPGHNVYACTVCVPVGRGRWDGEIAETGR